MVPSHKKVTLKMYIINLSFKFSNAMFENLKLVPALFDFSFSFCVTICWHGLSVNDL